MAKGVSELARLADGTATGAGDLTTVTGRQVTGLDRTDQAAGLHAPGGPPRSLTAPTGSPGTAQPPTPREYCQRVADLARRVLIEARAASALDTLVGVQVDRGDAIDKGATAARQGHQPPRRRG